MRSFFPSGEKLFISYSHVDAPLVKPFVDFLRAFTRGAVFRDQDSIPPGERWTVSIARAIDEADRVCVFWCRHAAGSDEVRREYRAAIGAGKRVVPTLLDSTPLPPELGAFQWCDMREAVRLSHAAGPVRKNSLLRDPDVHSRMAHALLRFLAQERSRARRAPGIAGNAGSSSSWPAGRPLR